MIKSLLRTLRFIKSQPLASRNKSDALDSWIRDWDYVAQRCREAQHIIVSGIAI